LRISAKASLLVLSAQCAKPEFRGHAQCEAVRRQQQLDEEKRNPTLVN